VTYVLLLITTSAPLLVVENMNEPVVVGGTRYIHRVNTSRQLQTQHIYRKL
jgi:hypothetical protein